MAVLGSLVEANVAAIIFSGLHEGSQRIDPISAGLRLFFRGWSGRKGGLRQDADNRKQDEHVSLQPRVFHTGESSSRVVRPHLDAVTLFLVSQPFRQNRRARRRFAPRMPTHRMRRDEWGTRQKGALAHLLLIVAGDFALGA